MTDDSPPATDRSYVRPKDVDNRATFGQRLLWGVEAFAWDHLYWNRFRAMPIDKASMAGAKLFAWAGPRLGGAAHRTATRNLRLAFPDWTEAQRAECLDGTWRNFGHIAGELPHLKEMRETGDDPRLVVVGQEHLQPLLDSNQPVVYISGHLANWEVMITAVVDREPDCEMTYRSVNNPHIDRCIAQNRLATGVQKLAAKGIGTRDLMRALSSGRSVALMNDQKFNQGISVPFFGHDCMTAPGPTRLALKYKAPLVMFSTVRTGPGRYRITIHPPHWPNRDLPAEQAVENTVRFINRWMEARIREAPDQWFWQHNRWSKDAWVRAGVM